MVKAARPGRVGRRFESRRCDTSKTRRRPIHGHLGGLLSRKARRMAIYVSVAQVAHCAHSTAAQNKWHANLLSTGNQLPPGQVGTAGVALSILSNQVGQKISGDLND